MSKNSAARSGVCLLLFASVMLAWVSEASAQTKVSVFNYGTLNLESSGYGTTITNTLLTTLAGDPAFSVVERKELEAFLSLNDLQQDERIENIVNVGTRLGINMIVVGNVEKKGAVIAITSKVILVEDKKVVFNNQLRVLGDAGLISEVQQLGKKIAAVITAQAVAREPEAAKASLAGVPVNIQLMGGNQCIRIVWADSSVDPSAGYEVFRAEQEGGQFVRIGQSNKKEYHDQNLEFGKIYYYKVRSISAKGVWSDYSAVASGKTILTPGVPVILKAEGHIKGIQLTWSPNPARSEDPLKMTGYKLDRSKVDDWTNEVVINLSGKDLGAGSSSDLEKLQKVTYLDKGLAEGADYYYRISAFNEGNAESEHCSVIKGTTLTGVARLTAQGNLIREVRLAWPAVDSPFIKGYNIYRSTSDKSAFTKIKRLDSFQVGPDKLIQFADKDGLADDVQYFYQVTAFEEGEVETTSLVTASAITRKKPPVAQGVSAKGGLVKKVEIIWQPSTSDDVEGYNVYWSKGTPSGGKPNLLKRIEGRTTGNYTDTHHNDGDLDDNATYSYLLTTFNKLNVESEFSESAVATTKPRPVKPTGLKGEDLRVKSTVLTWQANPETDIAMVHVLRATGVEGPDFSKVSEVKGPSEFVDKDLKDGTVYRYRIRAEDKDGLLSDFSDPVVVRTKPKPRPPENLTGEFRQGKAELRWNPGAEADLDHYGVYEKRFLSLGREKVASVRETTYSDVTIAKGKTKTYIVTAVDKDGLESEASREITVTAK
jgi:hypothetical protein